MLVDSESKTKTLLEHEVLQSVVPAKKGNLFFGGAGFNGEYIPDFLAALTEGGLQNVYPVPQDYSFGEVLDAALVDVTNGQIATGLRAISYDYPPDMPVAGPQLNLIGYSFGALVAIQLGLDHARRTGDVIDHLVLLAAPVYPQTWQYVSSPYCQQFFKKILVFNIGETLGEDVGKDKDPVRVGIWPYELTASVLTLADQQERQVGHFYYAVMSDEGKARRRQFAKALVERGLK